MGDHEIDAAVANRKHVHGRERQVKAVAELIVPHALGDRAQHRPREVEAGDMPAELCERYRVASRAAADVKRARVPTAAQFAFREPHQDGVRR